MAPDVRDGRRGAYFCDERDFYRTEQTADSDGRKYQGAGSERFRES